MALSFYTNRLNNHAAGNHLFPPPSSSPSRELFALHEDSAGIGSGINSFFSTNLNSYSDVVIANGINVFTPSPEFQASSLTYQDPYYNLPYSSTFNNQEQLLPVEHTMTPPELPSELPPLPGMLTYQEGGGVLSPWYCRGGGDNNCEVVKVKKVGGGKGSGSGGGLSTQSMAARVRRRKISEKTQELGKLIPGGRKMNTAEMFQSAFKYIKFLEAQIGVLKILASLPEHEEVLSKGEIQALLTCTLMQERLYIAEKCIGPKHLAETVSNHH